MQPEGKKHQSHLPENWEKIWQKVKREKKKDQTRKSNIWNTGDLRKENRENEGEELKELIQEIFQEQEDRFQIERAPQAEHNAWKYMLLSALLSNQI